MILTQSVSKSRAPKMGDAPTTRTCALVVLPPAFLALLLGLWQPGLSFWRDEAVTVGVIRRTIPDIFRFLANLDAVYGTYYLLLHPIADTLGTGELTLRFPSILATAATAAATAHLANRLMMPKAGLAAGLLYAGAPFASRFAHEARPYAIATMLTVLATIFFLGTIERPSRRSHLIYGGSLVLLGMIHLFALLVVIAHLVTLTLLRGGRTRLRPWFITVTAVATVLLPLIGVAMTQRNQVSWLRPPRWNDVSALLTVFAGSRALIFFMAAAISAGAILTSKNAGKYMQRTPMVWSLAAPWLLVPPTTLLLISQLYPLYSARYVSMSLPALALLASVGVTRVPGTTWLIPLVLYGALAAPSHMAQRRQSTEPDQLREAARIISSHASPGDAIVYLPTNRRAVAEAYPDAFQQLRDVTLNVSPASAGNLGGIEATPQEIRRRLTDATLTRVWLLEGEQLWRGPTLDALNHAKIDALEKSFRQDGRWRVRSLTLTLYVRTGHSTSDRRSDNRRLTGEGSPGHL
ncbi:glycosyltransferase family 39 protein [Sphaerimonospora sp. CA-214678]|uniref:glycosyltransferase family 39 protein n=1 Tax=Sphaerimonospora sp. CA-214678 TaxID=3240029 RepID=UPI003D8A6ACC